MSENEQPNESIEKIKESIEEVKESVEESVEEVQQAVSGGLSSVLALKESNPKVFFGGIGLLLAVVLLLAMSGGEETPVVSGKQAVNLAIGKQYILKSPNSYDDKATIQLLPVPGTIAAYDDGASEEDKNPCKAIVQGTHVSVMNFQDAFGKKNTFAQVKIEEGVCKDKDGWVLAVDLE